MDTIGPQTDALAASALSRKPRQGRSLASYERMLDATKAMLLDKGSEDFTLQDVSEAGNVSIGSIYLRFESKDRLIHAVVARELNAIVASERALLDSVLAECPDLERFLGLYIERYSAFLAGQAPLLRTIMQRASLDPEVSGPGKETAMRSLDMAIDAIMRYAPEVRGANPREKAQAVFQIIFATLARQFGLGATPESGDERVWAVMKHELAKMTLAYLRFDG